MKLTQCAFTYVADLFNLHPNMVLFWMISHNPDIIIFLAGNVMLIVTVLGAKYSYQSGFSSLKILVGYCRKEKPLVHVILVLASNNKFHIL